MIAGFVRGLSVRDVEATLVEALGEGAAVSKSTVSGVCEEIQAQFQAWSARRLDDVELDYLFPDGSHFKYQANASAEPVLAGLGIDTDGNLKCLCRQHHLLKTFWTGIDGWTDQQLPDGPGFWTCLFI